MLMDRYDVRFVFRSARRTPLLTSIVVLALSIGIGLNAGVFTVLNFLLLDSPAKKDSDRFVRIYPRYSGLAGDATSYQAFNAEDYDAIGKQSHALSEVAAWQTIEVSVDDSRRKGTALLASCNSLQTLGIDRPLAGRFLLAEDCGATPSHVVVLSEHFWKSLFNSDPHIIGKLIHVNHLPLTVIGIAADSSANVLPGGMWIPYTLQPDFYHGESNFRHPASLWLNVVARLNKGYSRADAKAEVETILRQRDRLYLDQRAFPSDRRTEVQLTNGSFIQAPSVSPVVIGLMGLIMGPLALVLLLACTNVTMLFLSRSVMRRGETAVRLALGAGRARLMRMLALESLLTALIAGLISIALAEKVPAWLLASLDPEEAPFASAMHPDWTVFGYLAALVLLATVASAFAPMRESLRFDLAVALKGREGTSTSRSRTTSALAIVQIMMSFVLLTAAVLFARLPAKIADMNPGFETRQVLKVPLEIDIPPYTQASAQNFYRTLEADIRQIPGVQALGYASLAPFGGAVQNEVRLESQEKGQGRSVTTDNVSADFFSLFSVALLRGRSFSNADYGPSGGAQVAVVSRSFATAFWGDADPLGRTIVLADGTRLTVVGVAKDTRSEQFGILDGPRLYTLRSPDSLDGNLYVRFTGDASTVAAAVRKIVTSLDSNQVDAPSTIYESVRRDAVTMQALARIILLMAGIAMLLAMSGLYAVLTFVNNRRVREFGIQLMLGATRQSIFGSVMRRGVVQIVIGLLGGAALAVPAAWFFANLTRRSAMPVQPNDLSMYGISALILSLISLCAMVIPALRATRVDPLQALRNE